MPESKLNLTYEDRKLIERSLDNRFSFNHIARSLDVHPTTVKREILRNRIVREGRVNVNAPRNICKNRGICIVTGICGPQCESLCRSCRKVKCSTRCDLYEPRLCERLDRPPYVCNSCEMLDFRDLCDRQRMFYDAIAAQESADKAKMNSGRKIALTEEQIGEMTAKLKDELKKGQSPEHIWNANPGMFQISVRTFYNYVEWGLFEDLKMHLPRYVRYSRTKKKEKREAPPNPVFDGRRYEDFKKLPKKVKKKASFKNLRECDVSLLCSHVNSYGRPILDGKAPLALAKESLPEELFEELGIELIEPREVILKPSLLPHLF